MNKKAYYQGGGGVNQPEPKKKKYKDEPIDQNLTKARGVFFQNYDLYDTGDPTPGTGLYQHMDEYDSVADFRKKKREEKIRKRRKAMFEAIMVSTASDKATSKKDKLQHLHKMLTEFTKLISRVNSKIEDENEVEDPTELTTTPIPWSSAAPGGSQLGLLDGLYPKEDMDGNPPSDLYYGRIESHPVMAQKK